MYFVYFLGPPCLTTLIAISYLFVLVMVGLSLDVMWHTLYCVHIRNTIRTSVTETEWSALDGADLDDVNVVLSIIVSCRYAFWKIVNVNSSKTAKCRYKVSLWIIRRKNAIHLHF